MSSIFLIFCQIGRTVFEFKGQHYHYSFIQYLQLQSAVSFLIIFPESTTSNSNIKFFSYPCCQHCCAFILCSLGPANRLRVMSITFIVIYLRLFPIQKFLFLLLSCVLRSSDRVLLIEFKQQTFGSWEEGVIKLTSTLKEVGTEMVQEVLQLGTEY